MPGGQAEDKWPRIFRQRYTFDVADPSTLLAAWMVAKQTRPAAFDDLSVRSKVHLVWEKGGDGLVRT